MIVAEKKKQIKIAVTNVNNIPILNCHCVVKSQPTELDNKIWFLWNRWRTRRVDVYLNIYFCTLNRRAVLLLRIIQRNNDNIVIWWFIAFFILEFYFLNCFIRWNLSLSLSFVDKIKSNNLRRNSHRRNSTSSTSKLSKRHNDMYDTQTERESFSIPLNLNLLGSDQKSIVFYANACSIVDFKISSFQDSERTVRFAENFIKIYSFDFARVSEWMN